MGEGRGVPTIRVLLVDDHQVVREGLRRMLELEDDIRVVGEATNVQEALRLAELHCPDVVLMDIKMSGGDGIEGTRLLKEKRPDCKIIMLTLYEEYVAQAIEAGAVGYLLKDIKREELSQTIRVAHQGQSPLDASLTRKLVGEFTDLARGRARQEPSLSERQMDILRLVAAGATNKQIASQLFLSGTTVKREMHSLFAKLEVNSRSKAVSEAYKRKLL
jgi:DNA-binding NarL/FixJ family response regulator